MAAASAAALAAGSARAAPSSFFGLVPNADLKPGDYAMIDRGNVGAARVTLSWPAIEPADDHFVWRATDRLIGNFASRGIASLPLLFATPSWVAGKSTKPPVDSPHQQREWRQFVSAAVARYGVGGAYWSGPYAAQFPARQPQPIDTWQIWNEENGPKHFYPKPKVGRYATLLRISKQAIHELNPRSETLTGGLASKPTGKGGIDAWDYMRALLKKRSGRQSLDHVALHPYAANARQVASHVKKLRRVLKKGGKRKAQVWITELGWSSKPRGGGKLAKTPSKQATLLQRTFKRLKRKRRSWKVGGVYWYTWRDFKGGICDWCPTAGLVTRGGKPKPAYRKYRRVARR